MKQKGENYAFIDGQNLYQGISEQEWNLDYGKFRVYLKEKYKVSKAYLFLGYIPKNQSIYQKLRDEGYILKFKPVLCIPMQPKRGNVDADLVLNIMRYISEYWQSIIVTSDGDFDTTIKYLKKRNKLAVVLSPRKEKCSALLRKAAADRIDYFENFKSKVEMCTKKAPL